MGIINIVILLAIILLNAPFNQFLLSLGITILLAYTSYQMTQRHIEKVIKLIMEDYEKENQQ